MRNKNVDILSDQLAAELAEESKAHQVRIYEK